MAKSSLLRESFERRRTGPQEPQQRCNSITSTVGYHNKRCYSITSILGIKGKKDNTKITQSKICCFWNKLCSPCTVGRSMSNLLWRFVHLLEYKCRVKAPQRWNHLASHFSSKTSPGRDSFYFSLTTVRVSDHTFTAFAVICLLYI